MGAGGADWEAPVRRGKEVPASPARGVLLCGGELPLLVHDVVAGVYGEDVGLVDVVLGVGVVGADADPVFGGQVVDGDRLACAGVGAGPERCYAGVLLGERGEGGDEGAGVAGAVRADEVGLEAVIDGRELDLGGGVGDDQARGRPGRR